MVPIEDVKKEKKLHRMLTNNYSPEKVGRQEGKGEEQTQQMMSSKGSGSGHSGAGLKS